MHELSVCQAIVVQVEKIASQHRARVRSITLKVGPLSGVEAALVEQAYPIAAAGTALSSAHLVIESLPVRVRCLSCHQETVALPNRMVCARCGDWHTELLNGDELLLASVELDRAAMTDITVQ